MSLEERFWKKVAKTGPSECWEWKRGRTKDGYGIFHVICDDGKSKKRGAHRVSYELEHKIKLTKDQHILHSCDQPSCVNPVHLSVGTNADNMRDKVEKGRQSRGMKCRNAKLTDEQVREIRRKFIGTVLMRELADEYGVDTSVVSRIVNFKSWIHIKPSENCTSQSQC